MIRHNTQFAALDLFKIILQGILNGDETSVIEPGNIDGLLRIKCYVKPEQVALCLGRQHIIKDSLVNLLRVICRYNNQEDIYIRFESLEKKEVKNEVTTNNTV